MSSKITIGLHATAENRPQCLNIPNTCLSGRYYLLDHLRDPKADYCRANNHLDSAIFGFLKKKLQRISTATFCLIKSTGKITIRKLIESCLKESKRQLHSNAAGCWTKRHIKFFQTVPQIYLLP